METHRCKAAAGPLDATVTLPGSKSLTNRALAVAALADGISLLAGILLAEDTRLMVDALAALGVRITLDESGETAEVTGCRGQLPASEAELFCGNSGTTIRFCAALAALGHGRYRLDGTERMRQRPIGGLVEALGPLGVGFEYLRETGYPPLTVHARGLWGGHVAFHESESSQFISGLLLAAPYAARDVLVDVTGSVPSAPYLRMTTAVMEHFGVSVIEQYGSAEAKFIVPAPQRYQATSYRVEPDASNATYFLAAAAVAGGRVTVEGLGTTSVQGDVGFADALEKMGCLVERHSDRIAVTGPPVGARLRGIDIDLNAMPDTAQTLAVVALFADGPTTIRNVANLRVKETDRLAALASELAKLGAGVEPTDGGLTIHPPDTVRPATIDTYDDHRMAMSFAVAGLACDGLQINDPGCCRKTFPDFFDRFERLRQAAA